MFSFYLYIWMATSCIYIYFSVFMSYIRVLLAKLFLFAHFNRNTFLFLFFFLGSCSFFRLLLLQSFATARGKQWQTVKNEADTYYYVFMGICSRNWFSFLLLLLLLPGSFSRRQGSNFTKGWHPVWRRHLIFC